MKVNLKAETVSRKKSVEDRVYEHDEILEGHEGRLGNVEYDVDKLKGEETETKISLRGGLRRGKKRLFSFFGREEKDFRKKAEKYYNEALKYIVIENGVMHSKGDIEDLKTAIMYLNNVLEIDPKHHAWFDKAFILSEIGDILYDEYSVDKKLIKFYKQAIEAYDKYIQLNPNNSHAWNNKGLIFEKLGKYEKAKKCFETSLKINPGCKKTENNLRYILRKME